MIVCAVAADLEEPVSLELHDLRLVAEEVIFLLQQEGLGFSERRRSLD